MQAFQRIKLVKLLYKPSKLCFKMQLRNYSVLQKLSCYTRNSYKPSFGSEFKLLQYKSFCTAQGKPATQSYVDPVVPAEAMQALKIQVQKISQCMALGQYADAQNLLKKYKVDLEVYFTPEHPAYLSYENNQGVLWRLNGQFEEAYELLISVYNKYTSMLGTNNPSTISACVNVATVLRDLKDYKQSIKYYEEAKQARIETVGESHPDYAMVLGMSAGKFMNLRSV
jgi:tetratricopeptide (TPR) repeat protein